MKTIKTGTFLCWLFGHKFIGKSIKLDPKDRDHSFTKSFIIDHCVRCGIKSNE